MKLLHLADLHIGKIVNEFSMIDDQRYILDEILHMIDEQKPDGILIAGDVYDKAVPSEEAVKVLDYFLRELADRSMKTYMISGNHDSDERLHFGSSFFESHGIYIASKYEGQLCRQTFTDEYGEVNLYLMPYVKASQVKRFFPEEEIDSYDQAVRVILKSAGIDEKARNILVAHQFVTGGTEQEDIQFGGSENLSVRNVGTIEKIGADCFEAFDYVALGHIHAPQRVSRDTVRYAGSPLKYSFSEVRNEKSVPLITITEKGSIEVQLLPLKPRRNMRHIKGEFRKLREYADKELNDDNEIKEGKEDYIYVTLTDEDPVPDAMGILRQYYPNIMSLTYENSHTKGKEEVPAAEIMEGKNFEELFADFYLWRYGCEMSEDERKLLLAAAREAGVADETNEA